MGTVEWPPCATDGYPAAVCADMLSSDSRVSCETDFCAECSLKGKCDHTCGLPCPDGAARWPPGQPFLMCFDATCRAPPAENPVGPRRSAASA